MSTITATIAPGRTTSRVATALTILVTLFLAFDAITHLLRAPQVVEANARLGAPEYFIVICGAVLSVCLIGYHVPATRAMATVLLTAYLGGACAANLMTEAPAFNTGFAILTGVAVWGGAWPRDERLRALIRR